MMRRRAQQHPSHPGGGEQQDVSSSSPLSTAEQQQQDAEDHKRSKRQEEEGTLMSRILFLGVVIAIFCFLFFAPPGSVGNLAHSVLYPSGAGDGGDPQTTKSSKKQEEDGKQVAADAAVETNTKKFSLLAPEQDAALEIDEKTGLRYHLIFSTDCSPYQQWQSYLVYFTALKVRQPGHVTRIASGCDKEGEEATQKWFQDHIQHMSSRFHLQLTPHFSGVKDAEGNTVGDYKFFNKPFGTKYWLENSPQLKRKPGTNKDGDDPVPVEFDDSIQTDVVILIDPDMTLLRPITADFSDDRETLIGKPRRDGHILSRRVEPGKPFAQVYGFGTQWQRLDLARVTQDPNSPAISVTQQEGRLFYPVGPPYIATVPDMYRIASSWSKFVPETHRQYPYLLAEMFAFCIAAAHEKLPHQLIDSLMVSAINAGGEGWPLVDALPDENVCAFAKNIQHDQHAVPSVLHLCQRYFVNEWFFSKRKVPAEVLDCDQPLWKEPPDDLDVLTTTNNKDAKEAKRHAFVTCSALHTINEAATYYKQNACPTTGNFEATFHLKKP